MTITEPQRFLDDLEQQLVIFSPIQQLAFGAICSERHFPEYLRFSTEQHWGNPDVLKRAIDVAWAVAAGEGEFDREQAQVLLAQCVDATPDSDDFPNVMSDYAQDAAIMVCHLVQFLGERSPRSLVLLASRARDLIDAKIQFDNKLNPADPELEMKIATDQAMVSEINIQREFLKAIASTKDPHELALLRNSI